MRKFIYFLYNVTEEEMLYRNSITYIENPDYPLI